MELSDRTEGALGGQSYLERFFLAWPPSFVSVTPTQLSWESIEIAPRLSVLFDLFMTALQAPLDNGYFNIVPTSRFYTS